MNRHSDLIYELGNLFIDRRRKEMNNLDAR